MPRVLPSEGPASAILWNGRILAVQCRAWVWRYLTDNRTHYHLGFNLWVDGEAADKAAQFIVAISGLQQSKLEFRPGDVAKGTAWPCKNAKREIADFYRAGNLRVLSRTDEPTEQDTPPFVGKPPPQGVFETRGARMLDLKRWKNECMACKWANKSAVEIEYNFGKSKRYRTETFCYGPKSCPLYAMGKPRAVPYYGHDFPSIDDGALDGLITAHRGQDE